jgi:ribosomal protein L12E/L44/L45/RPP1/RPP2
MALAGLTKEQKDEHIVCFAAAALHDGGAEINADAIKALVEATGNEVEAYWPMIAAKFFTTGDNLKSAMGGRGQC